jgi:protein involved in polysaccharide export with SLBB domain
MRLLRALAESGGASLNGDLAKLTLTRAGGEKIVLDLSRPETKGGTAVDVLLERGDLIYIPERRMQISILGEVARPGSMEYRDEMTLLEAITSAGGVKETADLSAATLIHNGKEAAIDLEALLRRGDLTINIKLASGDRLFIPEIRNRVYVFGAVARPGFYLFKAGDRILDALNGMGGPLREADLRKVTHVRINREENVAQKSEINVDQLLKKGDLKGNIALEAGDVLFVPDRKRGLGIQDMWGLLGGVNLFTSIGRLFTVGF